MYLKIFKSKSTLMKMTFCAAFVIGTFAFTSCESNSLSELEVIDTDTDVDVEEPEIVTYDNTARSIIDTNCMECHRLGNSAGGERLDNFENASAAAASGRIIARMTDTNSPMPPSGNLSDDTIEDIMQWIEDGILEN